MAELVRALAWTGDRTVPSRVRIPLRKLRFGTSTSIYPALPVSFGGDTKSSAGSIPDSYDIYRYLNLVRYSILDTFVVNLPKTYISLLFNRVDDHANFL